MLELLIVDDDDMVRESLAMLLRREGFAVSTAASGEAAIEAAGQQAYDIIVTDIRMPGADGIEVVRQVQQLQPDTHCVIMTGFASEESTLQALRLRVDDYFHKPFDLTAFVERIRAIGRGRLRAGADAGRLMRRFVQLLSEAWPAWGDHAERTRGVMLKAGQRLGVEEADLAALGLAASFHDLRNLEEGPLAPAPPQSDEDGGLLERAVALLSGAARESTAGRVFEAVLGDPDVDDEVRAAVADADAEAPPKPAVVPANESLPLMLTTLGPLRVEVDGVPIERADWESASARTLFLLLLCERGRRVSEDRIIEALWPDSPLEKARRSLKTAVYRVRKALRGSQPRTQEFLVSGERYYHLDMAQPHRWDVEEMERAAKRARALEAAGDTQHALREWKAAAALHGGTFLEGLEYEWLQPLRDSSHSIALLSRTRAAAAWLLLGDAPSAEQQARQALDLDRACEEAQVLLVRALGQQGRRDDAVRAYHAATATLNRVLGLGPGPELLRAYLEVTT